MAPRAHTCAWTVSLLLVQPISAQVLLGQGEIQSLEQFNSQNDRSVSFNASHDFCQSVYFPSLSIQSQMKRFRQIEPTPVRFDFCMFFILASSSQKAESQQIAVWQQEMISNLDSAVQWECHLRKFSNNIFFQSL